MGSKLDDSMDLLSADLDSLLNNLSKEPAKPPQPQPVQQFDSGSLDELDHLTTDLEKKSGPPSNAQAPPQPAGRARTFVSTGPGAGFVRPPAAGRAGAGIQGMATHTPDGKRIKVNAKKCDNCGEMIVGKVTNALGKTFHPEHFVCANCQQPFPDGKFLEHEGKPYCDKHYYEMFAPRCARCQQPIMEKLIRACEKSWHSDHFSCSGCGIDLVGKVFKEAGGEPYCPKCKKDLEVYVDPKIHICAQCKRPIMGEYILLSGQYLHPEHFRCNACGKDLENGAGHEYQGKLYCKEDYDKLQKDTCAGCRKPIIGRSITAMGRCWHPEHFCCAHCHAPFGASRFFERDGMPYCEPHYKQLFGKLCAKCNSAVVGKGGGIEMMGKIWHLECFCCQGCNNPLKLGAKVASWEGKPLCRNCYLKLPREIRKKLEKKQVGEEKMERKRKIEAAKEANRREKDIRKRENDARKAQKGQKDAL